MHSAIGGADAGPGADVPVHADSDDLLPEAAAEPGSLLGPATARTPASRFAARHGFLHPPELVRFRALDQGSKLLGEAQDLTVTAEAFSTLNLPVQRAIITENLVNFPALPHACGQRADGRGNAGGTP